MANDLGLGLGILAGGALRVLGARAQAKKAERLREEERNDKLAEIASSRLYEMAKEGNPRAAALLDVQSGYATDPNQKGFGALMQKPNLAYYDSSNRLSPTDVRLGTLKTPVEDFKNFESRVAPQAQERSSSAFVGPFQVGAEMARRKAEEAQAAKRDYQAEIERRSIDDAYKGVDELALKGGITPEEYKKVLQGRQEWLKTGDKTKIFMPEQLTKVESALDLKRMDRADTLRNQSLNNIARSFDVNTAELAKLDQAAEQIHDNWDKQQKSLEELGTEPGRIEILKEKLLYKRLNDIDKRRNDVKKRQEGLLEREAELLGSDSGKMAGKPTAEPPPEVKLRERADDFQTTVYNSYLSELEQQFQELAKKNLPNLQGPIDKAFYDPMTDDNEDLRNFVQGTVGLENYDVRQPEAIYQAMKAKALEKMQADFAQAYPELAPKQEQKPKAPENLRAPLLKLLQLSKVQNPENYIDDFYELNPDLSLEEVNAKIQELENAGR